MEINISVSKKVAFAERGTIVVCGNGDYVAKFTFDEEWAKYETKTARFKWGGKYTDVVFSGDECAMPIINNTCIAEVGVYAGDLHTTTPALIRCKRSILCGNEPESPASQEVKNEFLGVLDKRTGDLSALKTDAKDSLVTAINEVARTGSGAEVFYIDLAGNYPDYTCPVAMADIKAAYAAGKVLECRCTRTAYTVTLPLLVSMPAANTWIFSGSGALTSMDFATQSFTVAITANGVVAQGTILNKILRISVGPNVYLYDGSAPVNVVIDDDSSDAVLYTAQTLTDAQKQQARENVDAAIADFMVDATLNFGGIARLDKTFEQIKEAITAGKNPVVHVSGLDAIESYLQLAACSVSFVRFVGMAMNDERDCAITFELIVKSDIATYSTSYLPAADTYGFMPQVSMLSLPTKDTQIATKQYVDNKEFILQSTTPGSSKKFKITVDDSGALSAVEVTE